MCGRFADPSDLLGGGAGCERTGGDPVAARDRGGETPCLGKRGETLFPFTRAPHSFGVGTAGGGGGPPGGGGGPPGGGGGPPPRGGGGRRGREPKPPHSLPPPVASPQMGGRPRPILRGSQHGVAARSGASRVATLPANQRHEVVRADPREVERNAAGRTDDVTLSLVNEVCAHEAESARVQVSVRRRRVPTKTSQDRLPVHAEV